MEAAIEETLAYYAFPEEHWWRIRTNNPLERILRENYATPPAWMNERCHHRVSQGRGAAQPNRKREDFGHYPNSSLTSRLRAGGWWTLLRFGGVSGAQVKWIAA